MSLLAAQMYTLRDHCKTAVDLAKACERVKKMGYDGVQLSGVVELPGDEMQKILEMSQMQDAVAGLDFQGTGKMVTPLGAALLHAPEMTAGTVIGLDKNCALEMVQAGGVVTDYDKLIDRQLERAAITCTAGFSKIFTEAAKTLS